MQTNGQENAFINKKFDLDYEWTSIPSPEGKTMKAFDCNILEVLRQKSPFFTKKVPRAPQLTVLKVQIIGVLKTKKKTVFTPN